jgi:CHAT domain-containing protein
MGKVRIAGRCRKTVAFVAILAALTTFGALETASPPTHGLPPAFGTPRGVVQSKIGKDFQGHYAPRNWTAAIALRHVAILALAARQGIEPAPSLANEALEVAQLASQSSAAAAIQRMSRLAPIQRRLGDDAGPLIDRRHKGDDGPRAWLRPHAKPLASEEVRKPLTTEEVQILLGAHDALVFFLVGASESYVFALTRERFEWRTISLGEENLSIKVAAFRRGLDIVELTKSVSTGTAQLFDLAAAHELYVALLGPVEALIKDKPQLLIVPSGPLTALPFHLLVMDKPVIAAPQTQINNMAAYRDAAWLVKRHAVTVLPSVANLKALRVSAGKGRATKPMIGFGDPVFAPDKVAALAGQRTARVKIAARTRAYSEYWQGASVNRAKLAEALAPLPDSADELKAVAAKLGASSSDIHIGRNATEANVKRLPLADYRVVYFATHGLVAGDVEGLGEPSLALTLPNEPSELDDGLLTASEVAQLELNADWVVLSACNTAAGEKPGAEALSGLARAFFYAGARALLVSHWGIDSKAAARLSTSTFDIMNSDQTIGRAEALRRAMLAYLNDKSDDWNPYPAFWGSFSLVGEGTVPDGTTVWQATRMPSFLARLFGGGKEDGATVATAKPDAGDSPPVNAWRHAASVAKAADRYEVASAGSEPVAAPGSFGLASANAKPVRLAQSRETVTPTNVSANDIIKERGYWRVLPDAVSGSRPVASAPPRATASARPATTASATPWPLTDRGGNEPIPNALAYAAQPAPIATARAVPIALGTPRAAPASQ